MKVATRNNLLKKLANYKWRTNASTIRTTEEKYVRGWRGPNRRETLFVGHTPSPADLKSRHPILPNVQPMDFSAKTTVCELESEKSYIDVDLLTEDLAKGHNSPWLT